MDVGARRRPCVVERGDGDARPALLEHRPLHAGPQRGGGRDEQGVDVRFDRIEPRRNEVAGPRRLLLVQIVMNLRMPALEHPVDEQPRLLLGERVPVAVQVVADVVVIEERRLRPQPRRSERRLVPLLHRVDAVGIDGRHDQEDHLVADPGPRRSEAWRPGRRDASRRVAPRPPSSGCPPSARRRDAPCSISESRSASDRCGEGRRGAPGSPAARPAGPGSARCSASPSRAGASSVLRPSVSRRTRGLASPDASK